MRDRVCPIGECTATVRFDSAVEEVTPRFRLHDLGEVDEFAVCPSCDAEVAGFHAEADAEEQGGNVELILDIDDEDESGGHADDATADDHDEPTDDDAVDGFGDPSGDASDGFDAPSDDFDDPGSVIASAIDDQDADDGDSDDGADDDAADDESVVGASDDE